MTLRVNTGLRGDDAVVAVVGVGQEALTAVDDVVVAILLSGDLVVVQVGTTTGLCNSQGPDRGAVAHAGQVLLLLLFRTEIVHAAYCQLMREEECGETSGSLAELFHRDDALDMAQAYATVLFRNEDAEDTQFADEREQFARAAVVLIPLRSVGSKVLLCEFSECLLQHLLFFSEMNIHN